MGVSCSSTCRGQTEPIAALLAVAVVALAVTAHAGVLGAFLPGQSERRVVDATADRVWNALRSDGVYEWGSLENDSLDADSLPADRVVYVNVTRLTDDTPRREDRAAVWLPDGEVRPSVDPPDRVRVASRPIPVRTGEGTVTVGRLWVAVWEP